jgi:hypothetical protein
MLGRDSLALGLILSVLSGIAGLAGYFAALSLRIPDFMGFDIRMTTWRWMVAGVVLGASTSFA